MKKCNRVFLATLSIISLGLIATSTLASKENINIVEVSAYTSGDAATYYSGISSSATGTELLSSLQALNTQKRQSLVGYGNMPSKFQLTDPGTSSGQVTSFYSGKSARYSGNMNREHVWPASRTVGGRNNDDLEDDIHMTRPTLTSENSSRGNSFFAEGGKGGNNETPWDPNTFGNESYRGDSARIIFYCVVADSRLSIVDKNSDYTNNHTMGKLSDLLKWNLQYPVASRENTRNEEAEKLQGNRNPFIDHPEYACRIWGNTNDATRAACASQPLPSGGDGITALAFESETYTVAVGGTVQLKLNITPSSASSATVGYYSNKKEIATVSSTGLVSGLKNGKVLITAANSDLSVSTKTVVIVGTGVEEQKSGCGGNIYTTSLVLSTISFVGISLLLVKKFKER